MRSAARSNWLATMAFPDIAVRGVAGAVTGPPSGAGLQGAARDAGRRGLRFRQRMGGGDAARAAPPGIGGHAAHVPPPPRPRAVPRGGLEAETEPRPPPGAGPT